jgi:hypothetical protein
MSAASFSFAFITSNIFGCVLLQEPSALVGQNELIA